MLRAETVHSKGSIYIGYSLCYYHYHQLLLQDELYYSEKYLVFHIQVLKKFTSEIVARTNVYALEDMRLKAGS